MIDRFGLGPALLANRGTRQFQITRNRVDALLADQMTAPDSAIISMNNTPDPTAKRRMIVDTRVETIGSCLPPESAKFCTLLYISPVNL